MYIQNKELDVISDYEFSCKTYTRDDLQLEYAITKIL